MPVLTDGRPGISVLLIVAGAAILVAIGGAAVSDALRFEREAIMGGQFWRLLTGNLVHLGWSHLLLNLAGLGLIWALLGQALSPRAWAITSIVCALGVSLGILWLNPNITWYVGMSGVLHGYFAAAALGAHQITPGTRALMLGLLSAKLLWEQIYGSLPGTTAAAGGNVIVDAHLYGAGTGIVIGGIIFLAGRRAV